MRIKLPLFELNTDKSNSEPSIVKVSTPVEKTYDVIGGLLSFSKTGLSTEKTVSSRILEANKEWVYRNNDVIAQEVSKIEFELFSIDIRNGQIEFNQIDTHPLLDVLDKFNSRTTKSDGIYITQSHKKLTGDAFWLLERDNDNIIKNIYILPPDKIELVLGDPAKGGDLIKEYKYTDIIDKKKVERHYQPEEIVHFKKPNPKNPFRGFGAVEALADSIDTDALTNQTQRGFFEKGAISNFVLTTESNITQDQIKRLRAELRAMYTGARNAYTTMIFGNGLKPSPIGFSNKDMEYIPLMEWYRDKIMLGFGNTKASLGIIDDVNRASYEGSHNGWLEGTIKPDMDSICNTINEFLVPLFGENLILGYKNPVPENLTDDIDNTKKMKDAGIITINEARERLGLDKVDGGDIFAPVGGVEYPGKIQPEPTPNKPQETPKSLSHMPIKHILRSRKAYKKLAINRDIKERAKRILKLSANKKNVQSVSKDFSQETINDYYAKQINLVGTIEEQFNGKLLNILNDIQKEALANFEDEMSQKKIKQLVNKELFNEESFKTRTQIDLTPLLLQEAALAGQEAYNLLSHESTYTPYAIEEAIRSVVNLFAESMLQTDKELLSSIISDGVDNGSTVSEIRDNITNKFGDYTKVQAERITRTEVMRVSTMAAEDAFEQSDVVEGKQWLVAPNCCDICVDHANKVVKLGGNFYKGDNSGFQDGNPPLHPNCRCTIIPVVKGTKVFQQDIKDHANDMAQRIKELEELVDKRTKAYKDLKTENTEDKAYIKALEKHLGVGDE